MKEADISVLFQTLEFSPYCSNPSKKEASLQIEEGDLNGYLRFLQRHKALYMSSMLSYCVAKKENDCPPNVGPWVEYCSLVYSGREADQNPKSLMVLSVSSTDSGMLENVLAPERLD